LAGSVALARPSTVTRVSPSSLTSETAMRSPRMRPDQLDAAHE
jgi:hypothetical protein